MTAECISPSTSSTTLSLPPLSPSPNATSIPRKSIPRPPSRNQQTTTTIDTSNLPDEAIAIQCQRLLHLRHALRCPCNPSQQVCQVTPHCGKLKLLWRHLMKCDDEFCKVPLCITSRYALSHYNKCRDTQCRICQPSRMCAKRAHGSAEEEKQFLDQYQIKAPPTKRVRQSTSRASLALLGTTTTTTTSTVVPPSSKTEAATGGNTSDGSDSERDSSESYVYSSSSYDDCKDDQGKTVGIAFVVAPTATNSSSSATTTTSGETNGQEQQQKPSEFIRIIQTLAKVVISGPESF